jgi:hypothetical protein
MFVLPELSVTLLNVNSDSKSQDKRSSLRWQQRGSSDEDDDEDDSYDEDSKDLMDDFRQAPEVNKGDSGLAAYASHQNEIKGSSSNTKSTSKK